MKSLLTNLTSLFLFASLLFFSCKSNDELNIVYPEGGYAYLKDIEDKDTTFYFYPLKDILSTKDSFETANSYSFLHGFDEYNLSLRSNNEPILRLTYYGVPTTIITFLPEEIIVKEFIKGSWGYLPDTTKLSSKEKLHFDILERFFPLNDTSYKNRKKIYLDSLSKVYPELLEPKYYKQLLDKSSSVKKKFEYSLKRVPIEKKRFISIVNQINESGYWKLPFDNWCDNVPTDASGFMLEVNTPKKYNVVNSISCPDDTTKYVKACQELLNYAGLGKKIELIWSGAATTEEPVKARELKLTEIKEEPEKKKKKAK